MINADTIRQGCQCDNPRCSCHQPHGNVHCPGHSDEHPSLSVSEVNGKVLVKCHAGCSQAQVIDGLKRRGLWSSAHGNNGNTTRRKKELLATYSYSDAAGKLLFEVCRFRNPDGSKTFSQRRPLPGGGCIWGLRAGEYQCFNNAAEWYPVGRKGVDPMAVVKKFPASPLVPYRLPELLAADPADLVAIPEGEKDVDRLRALGMTAICNPMGAGKWQDEYNDHLKGRAVAIIPDKDEPGRRHAQKVALGLQGIAASIKIVELPGLQEKGDVSDWFDAGGTKDELLALVEVTPEWVPTPDSKGGRTSGGRAARKGGKAEGGDGEPTQTEILLDIATSNCEFFHDPDLTGYASFTVMGKDEIFRNVHTETWPVRSAAFRRYLAYQFFIETGGKAPNAEAMGGVVNILEAQAQFAGLQRQVFIRIGKDGLENAIYVDLGGPKWDAVKITPEGYEVVNEPPVKFRRSKGMGALPYPERGGSIQELRRFVNVGSDRDFQIFACWLLDAYKPNGPYTSLNLGGEQGSTKSTVTRVGRELVDPNTAPLRATPKEIRDLAIAANNSWVVSFDNLTGLPQWLSDGLCRLSTGGGFSTRELYTNNEEAIFNSMRPTIVNGINPTATKPDLADRSIILSLPQMPDEARRPEAEFWEDFAIARPRILGAIFDAISAGLRNIDHVKLDSYPRMADTARWITACESALPWPPGTLLEAYLGNRHEAVEATLEADHVAAAVRKLMEEKEIWEGSASDLLNDMEKIIEEKVTRMRSWPKAANALSGRLTRAATFLRAVGIEIVRSKSGNRSITITYKKGEKTAQTAQTAQDEEPHGSKADDPLDDPEFSDEATAQKTDHWTTADGSPERPPTWKDAPDVDLDDMGDMGDKNREFTGDDKNVFDWQEFEI